MKEEEQIHSDWYRLLFESDYDRICRRGQEFPSAMTKRDVNLILEILNLEKGASILDLCCGQGRHCLELAERGYQATGLDLSNLQIQKASQYSETLGINVNWLRRDMREIPTDFEETFDAVINLFSSFGYLESEEEDIEVLKGIRRSLKPKGQFLMETKNREWVIRNYLPRSWDFTTDGLLVLEERKLDLFTRQNHVRIHIFEKDGTRKITGHAMRLYSLSEMTRLYNSAGIEIKEVFGALDKRPYDIDSPRMVIVAKKG